MNLASVTIDDDIANVLMGIDDLKLGDISAQFEEGVPEPEPEDKDGVSSSISLPFVPHSQRSANVTPKTNESIKRSSSGDGETSLSSPSSQFPQLSSSVTEVQFFTPMKSTNDKVEWTVSTPPSGPLVQSNLSDYGNSDAAAEKATPKAEEGLGRNKSNEIKVISITEILSADSGVTRCFVSCNYNVVPPIFCLYRESSNTFLMSAGKMSSGWTSTYLISKDPQFEFDRQCKSLVGELQCDWFGLQYNLYGSGKSPWNIWSAEKPRELLTSISYSPNIFFDAKDRAITVQLQPRGSYGLASNKERDLGAAICLKNREPVWNEEHQCYILSFNGRAKLPSAKNVQLIDPENPKISVFQLGKYADNMYTVDVRWPLSLLEGFAIALSSLDSSEE